MYQLEPADDVIERVHRLSLGCSRSQFWRASSPTAPSLFFSACHSKVHVSLSCADWRVLDEPVECGRITSQKTLNLETRACPGCDVLYLKVDKRRDAYCGVCKIHFCWVCLASFNYFSEVYRHLRTFHGDIDSGVSQRDLQLAQRLQAQELTETGSDTNTSDSKAIMRLSMRSRLH